MRAASSVAIADLLASGHRPEPHEAVAIVLEVCRQVMRQGPRAAVAAPISTATVSIDAGGSVVAAGGAPAEDDQTVLLLGHLLVDMLGPADSAAGSRVPDKLRAIAVRACSGSSGSFSSVASLASALRRFGAVKGYAAIRSVFDRWQLSSTGKLPTLAGHATQPAGDRFDRPVFGTVRSGIEAEHDRAVWLTPLAPPPSGHQDVSEAVEPRARRVVWLTTAVVAGVTVLLLAGGALFWFTDVELPTPLQLPSARPVPASPPPGRELLPSPNRVPAKIVKVDTPRRAEAARVPAEPAGPERPR
jgi:hypothetical protein